MNSLNVMPELVISLWLLAVLWFVFFGSLRRDNCRSEIRRVRDELFDYVWQHNLSFSDPDYLAARRFLNTALQLSNSRFWPTQLVMVVIEGMWSVKDEPLKKPPASETPLRIMVEKAQLRAVVSLLKYLSRGGPWSIICVPAVALVTLLHHGRHAFRAKVIRNMESAITFAEHAERYQPANRISRHLACH